MMLAAITEGAADPVASAASSIIQQGVLGALLVVLGAFVFYLVLRLNKLSDARVKDQKEMSAAQTDLTTSLKGALGDLNGTMNALREATVANTSATNAMRVTMDGVVRDAVRGYQRRMSPPGGIPATGSGGTGSGQGGE